MINVFPAVEARYESHPVLHDEGHNLREGPGTGPPNTVITGVMIEDKSTFGGVGTGRDVEVWELVFVLTSKSRRPDSARRWLEAMRAAFHNADIIDPVFETAECRRTSHDGPEFVANEDGDELFLARTVIELTVQMDNLRPRTRGA